MPQVRVSRSPVENGGELVTYFCRLPDDRAGGAEIPLVSVLRDTLGDDNADNDRPRYVWAFGYNKPNLWKRFSATVPFLYRRAGGPERTATPPVLDMAAPSRGSLPRILAAGLQSGVVDPLGVGFRATSRSYRNRTLEYRTMHVHRALEVFQTTPVEAGGLSGSELAAVQGRLVLSTQLLGGYVSESHAPAAWTNRRHDSSMNRGRNWELLRQRAEENGLYFQPLRIGADDANFAMLWIEQGQAPQAFDARFLNISDPYRDDRIRNWTGYTETWTLGDRQARMIPLALYALDFPKVPLMLIDFRSPGKAKRREMAWRFTDDLTTGVLGYTGWGNLPYMAGKKIFFFVHGRRGSSLNRSARVRAYGQFRQGLLMDRSLPQPLHDELVRRAEKLGWNPFDEDVEREVRVANKQWRELQSRSAELAAALDRSRVNEIKEYIHAPAARWGLRLASLATFGIYRHRDPLTPERLAWVERQRLNAAAEREAVAAARLPVRESAVVSAGGGQ